MQSFEERAAFVARLVGEMQSLVNDPRVQSRLPEATERWQYFSSQAVLVVPDSNPENAVSGGAPLEIKEPLIPEAYSFIETEERPRGLAVFPIHPTDRELGPVYAYYTERMNCTGYGANSHMIIFNTSAQETDRFLATTLLHEIGHARAADRENRLFRESVERPEEERLREELHMWTFDERLAQALSGPAFDAQMYRLAERIAVVLSKGKDFQPRGGEGRILDALCGKAPSSRAEKQRDGTVVVWATLLAADLFLELPDSHRSKLHVLRGVCEETYAQEKELCQRYKSPP